MNQTQIDQSVLHDFYGGCQESMNEVFNEFLNGYSEMLQNLSSAYESGDLMLLKRMLHFHGPSFMYIGLPGISSMFKNLEMQCLNAENPFRVHAGYRELMDAVQEAWTAVCHVTGGYSEAV